MKLLALRIHGFGCFSEPVILDGFSGQLDVLADANEAGKSTAFEALQTVLLVKHSASTKALKQRRSDSSGAPLIEADLEIENRKWRIRKRYLVSKEAELTDLDNNVIVARGADADQEITRLIGGDQGAHHIALLWVAQRASLDDVQPTNNQKEILQSAIESEVSAITGGAEARTVRSRAADALAALVSATRRNPQGEYKMALTRQAALSEELETARDKAAAAKSRLNELAHLKSVRTQLIDPQIALKREHEIEETANRLQQAKAAHDKLKAAVQLAEMRQIAHTQANQALADFLADKAQFERLKKVRDKQSVDLKSLENKIDKARKSLSRDRREKQDAQRAEQTATKVLAQLSARRHTDGLKARLGEIEATAKAARMAHKEFVRLDRLLRKNHAKTDAMRRLASIQQDIALLEGRLQAAAPLVTVTYDKGAEDMITSPAGKLPAGKPLKVIDATDFKIQGIGIFRVEAGAGEEVEENQTSLAQERKESDRLLAQVGATDFAHAEQLAASRTELKNKANEAAARLEALAPEGLEDVDRQLDDLRGQIEKLAEEGGSETDISIDQAETMVAQAKSNFSACERRVEEAGEILNRLEIELAALKADTQSNLALFDAVEKRLPPPKKRSSHQKKLDIAVQKANEAVRAAQSDIERWRSAAPDDDELDGLRLRARRAVDAKTSAEKETARLDTELAAIEGALQRDHDDGTDEVLSELEDRLEAANHLVEKFEREIAALELLIETLDEVSSQELTRFLKPVLERLEPYFNLVFPGGTASFEEGFTIANVTRQGKTEPLQYLSDGTREQIAILVRLAFARLLAQTGRSVPLFLDDALVYSDDMRIERLFDALAKAAEEHQVIVFTCRLKSFDALGGNRLHFRKGEF